MRSALAQPLLSRLALYVGVAAISLVALSGILPGRTAADAQFARAELSWSGAPGSRVLRATEYVDARICRDLATHAGGAPGNGRVEVVCHFE